MAHTDNVIGFWDLDNDANDDSGNGWTLTNNNSVTFDGTYASFNGSNQTLVSSRLTALDGATTATFSVRVKRSSSGDLVGLGRAAGVNTAFSILWYSNDTLYVEVGTGSAQCYGRFDLSGTGEHHIVVVFDGGQTGDANRLKAYLDASQQTLTFDSGASVPSVLPSESTGWTFGSDVSGRITGGQSRVCAVYTDAKDSTWVTADYNSGTPKKWSDWNVAAYTLTAAGGTFSFTGISAGLKVGRKLNGAKGTFTLTGVSAGLKVARKLLAGKGSFALTGAAARLAHCYTLTGGKGSFAVTGVSAGLKTARKLNAAKGTFALSGSAATLRTARKLLGGKGSFALTGIAARLASGRALHSSAGSFAVTGGSAALLRGRTLVCSRGSFAVTGSAALRVARKLRTAPGTFALTGSAVQLDKGRRLAAGRGSFALTGASASLKIHRVLHCSSGSFAVAGHAVLSRGLVLTASRGQFVLTGQAIGLRAARRLAASYGQFSLTGHDAVLRRRGQQLHGELFATLSIRDALDASVYCQ